jgi:hypothetical protein
MSNIASFPQPNKVAEDFLKNVWGEELPEDSTLLLYTLPEQESHWFDDITSAATAVQRLNKKSDVYVGVCLAPSKYVAALPKHGLKHRCPNDAVMAMPGLCLDIDVAGPGRKKNNLFPSRESAKDFIDNKIPIKPTITIWSGGGFQLWFLFKEPWTFDKDEERKEAEALSRGWNHYIQRVAKSAGFAIDSTWDLARIFRIPGLNNLKNGTVKPITIVSANGPTYNPSDFEEYRDSAVIAAATVTVDGIIMDGDAQPPFDRFNDLCEIDRKFAQTWNHKRRDLPDDSMSSYDMSLANLMAAAGWDAQEIVNTLIAHRRKYGQDLKLRESYYIPTVTKALGAHKAAQAAREVSQVVEKARVDQTEVVIEDTDRKKILDLLENLTGVPVSRITQHGEDTVQFSIELKNGKSVQLGPVSKLTNFDNWINVAMIHGTRIPDRPKTKEWHSCLTCIKAIIEVVTADDLKPAEIALGWLRGYAAEAADLTKADASELASYIESDRPFISHNHLYIRMVGFKTFLQDVKKEKKEGSEILYLIRLVGMESKKVQARKDGSNKVVGRYYYFISTEKLYGYSDA